MDTTIAVLGVVATFIAAGAAIGSWRAAGTANKATETLERIESARRHEELTPALDVECELQQALTGRALLRVTLMGPPGLDQVDTVTLKVLDEKWRDRSGSTLGASGPTPQEIADTIWGPYRFVPNVDGTSDPTGRETAGGPLSLRSGQTWLLKSMELSPTPRWVDDPQWWQSEYIRQPIRLLISCRREAKTWVLLREIDLKPARPNAT